MKILVSAAKTGGHVFPAIAIGDELIKRGHQVIFLGSGAEIETNALRGKKFSYYQISMTGFRGKNILNKITRLIDPTSCDLVIEIGPGLGGLSEALVNNGVNKLLLIEKDKQFSYLLNELKSKYPNQIDICFEDAINFNFDLANYKNNIVSIFKPLKATPERFGKSLFSLGLIIDIFLFSKKLLKSSNIFKFLPIIIT